jgi:hypothetical protein
MSKRLQVILDDREYREVQRLARSQQVSIAAWVRQALVQARRREPNGDVEKKLAAIRAAVKCESPTPDIDTMLAEIEHGYLSGKP